MIDRPGETETGSSKVLRALLAGRHSCRAFLPDPVPRATIVQIVETARLTPSWCNSQPWQLVITEGHETDRFREALFSHAKAGPLARPDLDFPREYRGVYQQRRRACGLQLYDSVGISLGDRAAAANQGLENYRLFGAPHVAIVSTEQTLGTYGAIDCGAFVAAFLLAAHAAGVSSIAQAALAAHSDFIRSYFNLPQERAVVCGVSFGYEDREHRINSFRTERASLQEVVNFVGE